MNKTEHKCFVFENQPLENCSSYLTHSTVDPWWKAKLRVWLQNSPDWLRTLQYYGSGRSCTGLIVSLGTCGYTFFYTLWSAVLSHCVVVWCMGTSILNKHNACKVCVPCRWWQYVGTHLPKYMVPLSIKPQCESSLLWIAWNFIEISVCSMVYQDWWVSWEVKRWPWLTSECSSCLRFFVVSDLLKYVRGRIALPKNYWVSLQCICLFIYLFTC
jgi:hypothetical protein